MICFFAVKHKIYRKSVRNVKSIAHSVSLANYYHVFAKQTNDVITKLAYYGWKLKDAIDYTKKLQ